MQRPHDKGLYVVGCGIVVEHAMEPASLLPPSYWPRLVRRFWTALRADEEAHTAWDRLCQRLLGTDARPADCSAGILLGFQLL